MSEVELDTIRKLLQGALNKIDEGSAAGGLPAPTAVASASSDLSNAPGTPIIIVVAYDSALSQEARTSNKSHEPLNATSSECGCNERKVSHPGLERFTIERGTQTSVPKSCFMEPDRPCVNSGACEMRGF